MALQMMFINVVVPIKTIEEKCKSIGGLKGVLELNKEWIGKKVLYDKYLYKDAAMGGDDINTMFDFWEKQGLVLTEKRGNKTYWKDIAEVDFIAGPTLPCDWLEFEMGKGNISKVWMKGKPQGRLIKRFKHHLLHKIRLMFNI